MRRSEIQVNWNDGWLAWGLKHPRIWYTDPTNFYLDVEMWPPFLDCSSRSGPGRNPTVFKKKVFVQRESPCVPHTRIHLILLRNHKGDSSCGYIFSQTLSELFSTSRCSFVHQLTDILYPQAHTDIHIFDAIRSRIMTTLLCSQLPCPPYLFFLDFLNSGLSSEAIFRSVLVFFRAFFYSLQTADAGSKTERAGEREETPECPRKAADNGGGRGGGGRAGSRSGRGNRRRRRKEFWLWNTCMEVNGVYHPPHCFPLLSKHLFDACYPLLQQHKHPPEGRAVYWRDVAPYCEGVACCCYRRRPVF